MENLKSLIKRPQRKLREFHLRVCRFECSAKWKTRSWKASEFDQSTSEFDQNASEKISEVFISELSVLGMVLNGKLGGKTSEKYSLRFPSIPRTLSFRPFRDIVLSEYVEIW